MAGQMLLQPLQAQDSGAANHRRLAKSPGPPARLAVPIDCNTSKNMWCTSVPEHQQGAGLLGVQCGHGDSPAGTAACMDPPLASTAGAPKAGRPHPAPHHCLRTCSRTDTALGSPGGSDQPAQSYAGCSRPDRGARAGVAPAAQRHRAPGAGPGGSGLQGLPGAPLKQGRMMAGPGAPGPPRRPQARPIGPRCAGCGHAGGAPPRMPGCRLQPPAAGR